MKKILMYKRSIANLDDDLVRHFDHHCKVINFSAWIREQAFKDFGLRIMRGEDIDELDEMVVRHLYRDKSEWLREKMRNSIKLSVTNEMK